MKVRVIAGKWGGRFLTSPETSTTHPMGERMRGALFNILGDLSNKRVLDPFAGSGALGIEAVSRGAREAVLIERDKRAQQAILTSLRALDADDSIRLIKANCRQWSETASGERFDLILCDPPYHDIQLSTISLLKNHLNYNGLMVLSYPGRESVPTVNGVVVVDNRSYGDAALAIYRLETAPNRE